MKKYLHIAWMFLCLLALAACGDDDNEALEVDEVWKAKNEEAFQAQIQVPGFEKLESQSNAGFILYKILKKGESKEPIYFTSKVKVFYKGSFIDGTVFDDHSFEAGAPAIFSVSENIDGFTTALQYMHPGDRWEIWIPQQMGYGPAGKSGANVIIKPYTTLIFDLEVVEVVEQ